LNDGFAFVIAAASRGLVSRLKWHVLHTLSDCSDSDAEKCGYFQ
jgi:hypothetical protein